MRGTLNNSLVVACGALVKSLGEREGGGTEGGGGEG